MNSLDEYLRTGAETCGRRSIRCRLLISGIKYSTVQKEVRLAAIKSSRLGPEEKKKGSSRLRRGCGGHIKTNKSRRKNQITKRGARRSRTIGARHQYSQRKRERELVAYSKKLTALSQNTRCLLHTRRQRTKTGVFAEATSERDLFYPPARSDPRQFPERTVLYARDEAEQGIAADGVSVVRPRSLRPFNKLGQIRPQFCEHLPSVFLHARVPRGGRSDDTIGARGRK